MRAACQMRLRGGRISPLLRGLYLQVGIGVFQTRLFSRANFKQLPPRWQLGEDHGVRFEFMLLVWGGWDGQKQLKHGGCRLNQ